MDLEVKEKVILGIGAHADDLDFGSSGTIKQMVEKGASVYYLILTDGSKGFEDHTYQSEKLIKQRQEEQLKAAKILGVKEVFFLHFVDGELINSLEVRRAVVRIIRQLKPNIVITLDPTFVYDEESGFINHPDHRACGQATLDAIFPFARNSRTFPEFMDQGLSPHSVQEVFLSNFRQANFFVDISKTLKIKLEAIEQHKSQYNDYQKDVVERVTKRAETTGKKAGLKYAEGFVRIVIPH